MPVIHEGVDFSWLEMAESLSEKDLIFPILFGIRARKVGISLAMGNSIWIESLVIVALGL